MRFAFCALLTVLCLAMGASAQTNIRASTANLAPCDVDATSPLLTGSDIIAKVLSAMNSSGCANGGQIRIPPNPAGGCWVATTQLLIPNSGGTAPTQKTFLLRGLGAGGLAEGHGSEIGRAHV